MKKLLFAVLLIIPFCSYAQLEFGVNDGIGLFKSLNYNKDIKQRKTANSFNAAISYDLRHFKFGIGYNETEVKFSNADYYTYFAYQQHVHNVYLFSDYISRIRRSSFYSGILAGYTTGAGKVQEYDFYLGNAYSNNENKTGFSLGLHIGYGYDIWKGLGINADVSAIYLATQGKVEGGNEFYYFPITLGIHYKLHFRKKAPQETPATQVIKGM